MGMPELGAAESRAATHHPVWRRANEIRHADRTTSVLCEDGATILLPRLVGAHVQKGNEVAVAQDVESPAGPAEVLIRKGIPKRADIYRARAGYAAQPKPDRRGDMFVRVEVVGSQLGIGAIHVPCHVIRDYFFLANRNAPWNCQEPLYRFLRLTRDASFEELRLGLRIRRMELKQAHASRTDFATLERAYNLLADPQLRAAYNELLIRPDAPVPFPYSGFGSLLVEGATDGDTFFARRILAFLPEHRRRTFSFPVRKLDFFSDYAIVRDPHRKLEVLIDHQLLPLKWDQTWSQWRHLISGNIDISADFCPHWEVS
jgi:hypothetical protein